MGPVLRERQGPLPQAGPQAVVESGASPASGLPPLQRVGEACRRWEHVRLAPPTSGAVSGEEAVDFMVKYQSSFTRRELLLTVLRRCPASAAGAQRRQGCPPPSRHVLIGWWGQPPAEGCRLLHVLGRSQLALSFEKEPRKNHHRPIPRSPRATRFLKQPRPVDAQKGR